MAENPRPLGADPVLLADRFGLLAAVLIVAFSATVLVAIVPLHPLDLSWQYRFTGALTDNAPVALVGLALLHLAVYLDPENPSLQVRRRRCGRLASLAALAFLLVIPLQGAITAKGLEAGHELADDSRRTAERELSALARSIQGARSSAELVARLPAPVVQTLSPADRSLPLQALRKRLLNDVATARLQLLQRIDAPSRTDATTLWRRSIRVFICSLIYALAFAAFALRRGSDFSLLQELQLGWRPWKFDS